jgi:hypothetical protein
MLKKLEHYKDVAKTAEPPAKHRERGGIEK